MALTSWADMNDNMDWNTLASAPGGSNSGATNRFIRNKNEKNSGNFSSKNNGKQNNNSGNLQKKNSEQQHNSGSSSWKTANSNNSSQPANNASNEQEEELTSFITEEVDETSYAIGEVDEWTDMKQFDDDHDNEWFKYEENKMAELYGGKFIKVKYSSQGNVAYYCELCMAECNAKQSLDSHCGGMKHLKKKDLWEKERKKPCDVENPIGPVPPSLVPKPKPKKESWGKKRNMAPMSPSKAYKQSDYADIDEFNSSKKAMNYYGRDRYAGFEEPTYPRYRSPPRSRLLPTSPERHRMLAPSRRSPPAYRGYEGPDYRSGDRRGQSPMRNRYDDRASRYSPPPPPDFPKSCRSPSPSKKLSLSISPAGALLQKLAECCVKTESDADLAISVVGALTKSLKEYAYKNNEVKIAELLMEAELKVGTVKALKAGMKMLSSVTASTTVPDTRIEGAGFGRPLQPGGYSLEQPTNW